MEAGMSEQTEGAEPRFTLDEARRELALTECANFGHDWSIHSDFGQQPRRISCDRCGWSGSVVMGERPARAAVVAARGAEDGGEWRCASCRATRDEHACGERDGWITHTYEPEWVPPSNP